ncbi:hypothetical protein ABLG96_13880 [Nakamurella sp. A5-74]|uniref:Uncharacterized protein n=1 Tax=Nakamurella sp. A5-74 TaxID=3158264 RepID=A0AAU8DM02_9ACTN
MTDLQGPTFPTPHTFDDERGDRIDLTGDGVLDAGRRVIEGHWHVVQHDATGDWVNVPARAVQVDSAGPAVELGPFSLSTDDARLLAESLRLLADLADAGMGR